MTAFIIYDVLMVHHKRHKISIKPSRPAKIFKMLSNHLVTYGCLKIKELELVSIRRLIF